MELLTFNLAKMKLERTNFDLPQDQPLLIADVIGRLSSELNKQLEDYMIEGLKRKGFEFENRMELEAFIKLNCRCEDRMDLKQRTYFVNDIPFFLHCYEIEMDLNQITTDREVKMSANYGRYAYL
ncbi:MAG: hypothetical protein PHS04_07955 [Tissierellia bacterium]|nr:hypothetical protein [Tissierellia bacterium]